MLGNHLQSSLTLHQLPECEGYITGTCILSGTVHQIRCIWCNTLMFASEWLSETKLSANICQRKEVSCKGYRASIAHPWGPGSLPPIFIKVHGTQHGPPLGPVLLHSQNFGCSGLTLGVLASTFKMNARAFAALCTEYLLMECTLVYRDFCVHQWYINLVLILLYGFIFFLLFNQINWMWSECS